MDNCIECLGTLEDKTITYSIEIDGALYVVRNVPALVCRQCGAKSFTTPVIRRLHEIINEMRTMGKSGTVENLTATCAYTERKAA
ncbi:MAG: YgiT-type zinc finger protein [Selenomonadaceae bacterium]|nr:YgiT-type zinc finger protein [Selenomonadaceae bacterium]